MGVYAIAFVYVGNPNETDFNGEDVGVLLVDAVDTNIDCGKV